MSGREGQPSALGTSGRGGQRVGLAGHLPALGLPGTPYSKPHPRSSAPLRATTDATSTCITAARRGRRI